ncbi:MAG TPA: ComF family protein [Terriglobales bacterium]|jgi:ComF family protein|nr:ComF family protein [Terriglobales bacterium]
MSGLAESLFATLFPADCRLCGAPLIKISRLPVCQDCLAAMQPIDGGLCSTCGERLISPYAFGQEEEPLCGLCRRLAPPFAKAVAYGSYDGGLRELIHLLKYEQVRPAAAVLGRMLHEAMEGLELAAGTIVVPVPLHSKKRRQRGFNQVDLIVQAAMRHESRSISVGLDVLERQRETQSQIGLTSHQRRENMRGAFALVRPEKISGREVLLVDDVYTTGTTLSECAKVLKRAGASKVWVATVARTLKLNVTFAEVDKQDKSLAMAAAG